MCCLGTSLFRSLVDLRSLDGREQNKVFSATNFGAGTIVLLSPKRTLCLP